MTSFLLHFLSHLSSTNRNILPQVERISICHLKDVFHQSVPSIHRNSNENGNENGNEKESNKRAFLKRFARHKRRDSSHISVSITSESIPPSSLLFWRKMMKMMKLMISSQIFLIKLKIWKRIKVEDAGVTYSYFQINSFFSFLHTHLHLVSPQDFDNTLGLWSSHLIKRKKKVRSKQKEKIWLLQRSFIFCLFIWFHPIFSHPSIPSEEHLSFLQFANVVLIQTEEDVTLSQCLWEKRRTKEMKMIEIKMNRNDQWL